MIESLTKEQKEMLEVYKDKWLKIGLSTEPANHELAEDAINRAYKVAGLNPPKQIIWTTSPLAGLLLIYILKDGKLMQKIFDSLKVKEKPKKFDWSQVESQVGSQVWSQVESQVWSQVRSQVRSQVESQVWSQVRSQVWSQVESQVRSQVESQVWSQVESQVRSQVWSQVGSQVRSQVWSQVGSQVESQVRSQVESQVWSLLYNNFYGQLDSGWLSFYDYVKDVLKLEKEVENLKPLIDLSKHSNWTYLYSDICVISEKPVEIHMKNGRLHNENGPSIKYQDGFSVYSLNGVRMSEHIVLANPEQLDPIEALKETNVEIRREIFRKIGPANFIKKSQAKLIHNFHKYELYELDLGDGLKGRWLRMQNPSTDVEHIEGVPNTCNTVQDALKFRNQEVYKTLGLEKYLDPKILT